MFNQKVNHYTSDNPSYLNYSHGAPYIRSEQIHNCGTNLEKYKKETNTPLQTWFSKEIAVESFAMRPIVNSKEYFESIKKYLSSIVYTDSINLKKSKLSLEKYNIYNDNGIEPQSSFLQTINIEITNKLMFLFGEAANQIKIFKEYNPLCEGFIINDIEIETYQSNSAPNHFYHKVIFGAVNTTRYNTVLFKANLYQDTTNIMNQWTNSINKVMNSETLPKNKNKNKTVVYIASIDLLNNTTCVLGEENECNYKAYNINHGSFSQLLNNNLLQDPKENVWLNPESLSNDIYTNLGNYDIDGQIKIIDNGPANINNLIKDLGFNI